MWIGIISVLLVAWCVGWFVFYRLPFIAKQSTADLRQVSIIIPARNEAESLPRLLRSLQQQTLQPQEIFVVDDGSTDETITIARSLGATVLQTKEEHHGKPAACWLGATQAKGTSLLFLDADTFFESPDSLTSLVSEYEKRGGKGILSIQPFHQTVRFYEQLSFVFNVIILVGLNTFSILQEKVKAGGAFGPCILCAKADYLLVDGHNGMPNGILDDVALAKRFQQSGLPIHLYGGKQLIGFRMYPGGFKQLVEGWTKDFATASRSTHPVILAGIILWVSGGIGLVPAGLFFGHWFVFLMLYTIYLLQTIVFAKRVGQFKKSVLLFYPLLFIFFLVLFFWSLIQTYFLKSVTWKGRKIKL